MISWHLAAPSRIERPWFVWIGATLAGVTAVGAFFAGLSLITDPSGAGFGLPNSWISNSIFGSYFVPGLYLLFMNCLGMIALVVLILARHWSAPWWMGTLGVGLIIWILVQLAIMPETSWLQWTFLLFGVILGFVALFWLRRTGQLKLW